MPRFRIAFVSLIISHLGVGAYALPSPVNHSHEIGQALWQEATSPALPWNNATANSWNHNHLTSDPFSNGANWVINKAWDNRTLHLGFSNATGFGHGLIEASTPVRFGWDETSAGVVAIPAAAKNNVAAGFQAWVDIANGAYDERLRPDTRFAMAFQRVDLGVMEIAIQFVPNLLVTAEAYAQFVPGTATIQFDPNPTITLDTSKATEHIRIKTQAGGTTITAPTPWNYNDSPQLIQLDLEYSDDSGTTWADSPQSGFGNITWTAGTIHPDANPLADVHEEAWTVVGVLNQTHTASDRVIFIPLISFYAIQEHEEGLEESARLKQEAATTKTTPPAPAAAQEKHDDHDDHDEHDHPYHLNRDGTIHLHLPPQQWQISAILVQSRSAATMLQLQNRLRNLPDAIAVSPAAVMREFFARFMSGPFQMLILIAGMVTIVGAVSILVSIYNSVAGRSREIAIMRALGATRKRILAIVCLEAAFVGALGGILGLVAGHLLAAAGSVYLRSLLGTGIPWWRFWWGEGVYLGVVILVSLLAGLVPALKAYKTPVAENLVGN